MMTEQEHNNVQWRKAKLGNCLSIGNGCDYKHLKEGDIPVFGTGGIMTYVDNYLYDGETVCIGRKGTINHPMYHIGKIWTVDTLFYTHSFVDVIPKFIYYAFCNIDWNKYNEATGVPSLSKETIYKIEIPVPFKNDKPDLSAQRRIAAILTSADKVIAATQKTIAKYKQMKQGMMEELFKPKEGWKMVKLGECLKQKPDYGINAPAVPYDNNLPTYLRITDITEDGYYSKKDIVSVSSQDALKYVMDEGDLVFARTGASTGKTYLYNPQDGMLVFAGFLIRVRTDENKLLPEFFKYQTQTPQYKNWIAANSMRTGQPGINGNEYEEFPISIPYKNGKPDLAEQHRIAAILSGIDAKIAAEEKVLEKYEKVKKGLMERMMEEENER